MVRKISINHKINKKCKSLRKYKSKFYGGMPNYCGNKSLFQRVLYKEQIENWKPLLCSRFNAKNCGPTALKFIFPNMNPSHIQDLSVDVETTGITLERFNQFLFEQIIHLDVTTTKLPIVLPDILIFLKTNLLPGYISVIGLESVEIMNHITTIAKDLNDNIILFDGQSNMMYVNNDVFDYLKIYNIIYVWCSKHKYKHTTDFSSNQSTKKMRIEN